MPPALPYLAAALTLTLAWAPPAWAQKGGDAKAPSEPPTRVLKISHQWPAAETAETGDFRDRLCRRFARELESRTSGALRCEVFPDNKLVKPEGQIEALRTGAADLAIFPVNNAFDVLPELNVSLLPGLVKSYEHALRWKSAPIGRDIAAALEKRGSIVLTWVWLGGGIASRFRPILGPDDLRDLRIRGPGAAVDDTLSAFRGKVLGMPSSQIAAALRSDQLEVAVTTSSSILAFQLEDSCQAVTTPKDRALFYFLVPFVISKVTFDALTAEQRTIVTEIGASLESFALEAVRADDSRLATVWISKGKQAVELSEEDWRLWQRTAQAVSWTKFERSVPNGAEWLRKAKEVN